MSFYSVERICVECRVSWERKREREGETESSVTDFFLVLLILCSARSVLKLNFCRIELGNRLYRGCYFIAARVKSQHVNGNGFVERRPKKKLTHIEKNAAKRIAEDRGKRYLIDFWLVQVTVMAVKLGNCLNPMYAVVAVSE